jgi:hypothetical protein
MEHVYLPTAGSGGAPYIRRMLMAFDPDSHREFAFESDDTVSTIVSPAAYTAIARGLNGLDKYWGNVGFAVQLEEHNAEIWVGTTGNLEIAADARTGACSHSDLSSVMGFPFIDTPAPGGDTCQEMAYQVETSATLEHRNAKGQRDLLDRLTGRHITIHVARQTVPGVRIVTQCPEPDGHNMPPFIMGCMSRENFWRAQSQFATSLGIDLNRLTKTNPSSVSIHTQHVVEGAGPALMCCRNYAGHVRYTVYTPRGTVVRHVDDVEAAKDTVLRELWLERELRGGSRTLLLMPARYFDRSASQFALHVLDLTVLPCAAGLRRNDSSFFGNAYPDGGCYPAANYPTPR